LYKADGSIQTIYFHARCEILTAIATQIAVFLEVARAVLQKLKDVSKDLTTSICYPEDSSRVYLNST
jgi:hypothetical protein